ncbi:MAG: hypothetical protein KY464_06835 [Gemmatimonadetes bacterium]|nr:hypothetical protein [Gemmatimonadota bacterium]
MKLLKLLAVGAAVGVIVIAFRDLDQGRSTARALPGGGSLDDDDVDETEPMLGYDGMDVGALLDWFDQTAPDRALLERIRRYEMTHLAREAVLGALDDRL